MVTNLKHDAVEADGEFIARARAGDMDAMDTLVRRHQSWVFNLALRMVWRRDAAEDATQEILIKAVTRLDQFAGESAFRTWLYRIAVNHLLNVRQSEMEMKSMTFTDMGTSLEGVPDGDLPDERAVPVELPLLLEEARLGCVTAMLMCLDRRQRLAFILGEVLGETSATGAAAMDVSSDNFRQLLSRARRDLYQFMNEKCGLVNQSNPCRCARKAAGFMRNGWLDATGLTFSRDRLAAVASMTPDRLAELETMERQHAEIYRAQPFLAGPDLAAKLRVILTRSSFDGN